MTDVETRETEARSLPEEVRLDNEAGLARVRATIEAGLILEVS